MQQVSKHTVLVLTEVEVDIESKLILLTLSDLDSFCDHPLLEDEDSSNEKLKSVRSN